MKRIAKILILPDTLRELFKHKPWEKHRFKTNCNNSIHFGHFLKTTSVNFGNIEKHFYKTNDGNFNSSRHSSECVLQQTTKKKLF